MDLHFFLWELFFIGAVSLYILTVWPNKAGVVSISRKAELLSEGCSEFTTNGNWYLILSDFDLTGSDKMDLGETTVSGETDDFNTGNTETEVDLSEDEESNSAVSEGEHLYIFGSSDNSNQYLGIAASVLTYAYDNENNNGLDIFYQGKETKMTVPGKQDKSINVNVIKKMPCVVFTDCQR